MAKKTVNTETEYFEFQQIKTRLIVPAESDGMHYVQEGDDLLLVMFYYLDLDARRERWISNTNGFRPRNCESSRYAPHDVRYSDSFLFRAGQVVTPSQVVGINHTGTQEGKEALDRMYRSGLLRKIGVVESVPGQGLVYRLTIDGADLLFNSQAVALENCAHPCDKETGLPKRVPAGALYLATGGIHISQARPQMVERGMLVPEAVLGGNAQSLVAEGRLVPAGNHPTEYDDLELTPPVAAYFRNVAAIREDNRRRECSRDDAQNDFLSGLLTSAIRAAEPVTVTA
jgi:hypothetical protein